MGNTHRLGSMAGMNNRETTLHRKYVIHALPQTPPPLPPISMLWDPVDEEDAECFLLHGSPNIEIGGGGRLIDFFLGGRRHITLIRGEGGT